MGLVTCGDCGGKVSTNAAACPHCGRLPNRRKRAPSQVQHVQTQRRGGKYELAGFLMILGGMVGLCAGGGADNQVVSMLAFSVLVGGFVVFLAGRFM